MKSLSKSASLYLIDSNEIHWFHRTGESSFAVNSSDNSEKYGINIALGILVNRKIELRLFGNTPLTAAQGQNRNSMKVSAHKPFVGRFIADLSTPQCSSNVCNLEISYHWGETTFSFRKINGNNPSNSVYVQLQLFPL